MRRRFELLLLVAITTCTELVVAKPASWVMLLSQPPLDQQQRWHAWLELQPRFDLEPVAAHQLVVRPGVSYSLDAHLSLTAGYAWIGTYRPATVIEHRVWQQVQWAQPALGVRLRLEEQFFADGTRLRFRCQVRGVLQTSLLPIILSDEWFGIPAIWQRERVPGYDQNRVFLGVAIPLQHGLRVEAGYLNVHYRGNSIRHCLAISIIHQP